MSQVSPGWLIKLYVVSLKDLSKELQSICWMVKEKQLHVLKVTAKWFHNNRKETLQAVQIPEVFSLTSQKKACFGLRLYRINSLRVLCKLKWVRRGMISSAPIVLATVGYNFSIFYFETVVLN